MKEATGAYELDSETNVGAQVSNLDAHALDFLGLTAKTHRHRGCHSHPAPKPR